MSGGGRDKGDSGGNESAFYGAAQSDSLNNLQLHQSQLLRSDYGDVPLPVLQALHASFVEKPPQRFLLISNTLLAGNFSSGAFLRSGGSLNVAFRWYLFLVVFLVLCWVVDLASHALVSVSVAGELVPAGLWVRAHAPDFVAGVCFLSLVFLGPLGLVFTLVYRSVAPMYFIRSPDFGAAVAVACVSAVAEVVQLWFFQNVDMLFTPRSALAKTAFFVVATRFLESAVVSGVLLGLEGSPPWDYSTGWFLTQVCARSLGVMVVVPFVTLLLPNAWTWSASLPAVHNRLKKDLIPNLLLVCSVLLAVVIPLTVDRVDSSHMFLYLALPGIHIAVLHNLPGVVTLNMIALVILLPLADVGYVSYREFVMFEFAIVLTLMFVADRIRTGQRQARLLESAMNAATSSSQSKSAFLSTVSHELRTPLNGIIGTISYLETSTSLNQDQVACLRDVSLSCTNLRSLIGDILDYSKGEAGLLALNPRPFSLMDAVGLLEAQAQLFGAFADRKGLQLFIEYPSLWGYKMHPEAPVFVGDLTRLNQILTNIINNALKFTNEGFVHVSLSISRDPSPALDFSIQDSGVGIPEEKLGTIFHEFTQVNQHSKREHEGTGLGLAIASQLAASMKGDIGVTSVENEGTTFSFTFTPPKIDLVGYMSPEGVRGTGAGGVSAVVPGAGPGGSDSVQSRPCAPPLPAMREYMPLLISSQSRKMGRVLMKILRPSANELALSLPSSTAQLVIKRNCTCCDPSLLVKTVESRAQRSRSMFRYIFHDTTVKMDSTEEEAMDANKPPQFRGAVPDGAGEPGGPGSVAEEAQEWVTRTRKFCVEMEALLQRVVPSATSGATGGSGSSGKAAGRVDVVGGLGLPGAMSGVPLEDIGSGASNSSGGGSSPKGRVFPHVCILVPYQLRGAARELWQEVGTPRFTFIHKPLLPSSVFFAVAGINMYNPMAISDIMLPKPAPPKKKGGLRAALERKKEEKARKKKEEEERAAAEAAASGAGADDVDLPHILVAEDNAINRRVVGKLLSKFKVTVDFAKDGLEAVEAIQKTINGEKKPYSCILMDGHMPRLDGFQAAAKIGDLYSQDPAPSHPKPQIFALTADATDEAAAEARKVGMVCVVLKPITFKLLRHTFEAHNII